ncbi:MAG: FAD-binding oxidoreductase [Actinomycetia bacterium]|nr:FAD-binding oxidoreductase [Actinomycetes bacterium]
MRPLRVAVIGGGIAGVAAAFHLAERADVTLLEAESTLAYHTTGRSAALLFESYGSPGIRPLTMASRDFFDNPPNGLADFPFLSQRGGMLVGGNHQKEALEDWEAEAHRTGTPVERLNPAAARRICPALREELLGWAVWEPDAADMDVASIHQAFVRGARRRDAQIRVSSPVDALEKTPAGWRVKVGQESLQVEVVVNAAGAWGDEIARLAGVTPLGLIPMRRTVFMAPGSDEYKEWPLVANVAMEWYFKPDGVQLLCSLSEEYPSPPCDARPEPLDIALAIERINEATTLGIRSVRSSWTGLRTFAPDREMVIGFDPHAEGFFWLVGQGGTGIQTAPAAGELTASLVVDAQVSSRLVDHGLHSDVLSPGRFA